MWPSSSRAPARGFTLVELLVVMASLGMILWIVGQLMFPMRQAADRQRLQVEARQTARSALDYVSFTFRGATDMNDLANPRNPAAILTYLIASSNNGGQDASGHTDPFALCPADVNCVQLSYNNVDQSATSFATDGTDVVTFASTSNMVRVAAIKWPVSWTDSSFQAWNFTGACTRDNSGAITGGDIENYQAFKDQTGYTAGTGTSGQLILVDPTNGQWLPYRITDYLAGDNGTPCTNPSPDCDVNGAQTPCIKVKSTPSLTSDLNPPGALRSFNNWPNLVVGMRFAAIRVCNGWLEQKDGLFNPATDGNCTASPVGAVDFPPYVSKAGWTPLLPNIEDFQVAYLFRTTTPQNGPGGTMATTTGVPTSGNSSDALDITNVIGFRITVTARSTLQMALGGKVAMPRPAAEDHAPPAGDDRFYRYQASTIAMLRNRMAGE